MGFNNYLPSDNYEGVVFAKIPRTIDIAAITTAATVLGSKIIDYKVEMKKLEEVKTVNRHREIIEDNSKELKEYINKNEELKNKLIEVESENKNLKAMLEDINQTGKWNNWNPFRNPQEDDLYTSITNKLDEIFNFNIDSLSIIQGYALGN